MYICFHMFISDIPPRDDGYYGGSNIEELKNGQN